MACKGDMMATERHAAFISVGSNLGNKFDNCRMGIEGLLLSGKSVVQKQSSYYRTSPVDYTDQDWFVNAVVKIDTSLDPYELLDEMIALQYKMNQGDKRMRFGPRILDLDLIFYDDRVIYSPKLEIPHPRMHKRRFVLQPMCDIDPSIVHPTLKKSMCDLLAGLEDKTQKVIKLP